MFRKMSLGLLMTAAVLIMIASAEGDSTNTMARRLNWKGGQGVNEFGGCYYFGQAPACCKAKNSKGKSLYCFMQNPFYAQCLTVDGCKASKYPKCTTRSKCAADIIPKLTSGIPEFGTCFTPWEQGGTKGCCQGTNLAGEPLYCFYQNPYYAQCLTQARCKSDKFLNCTATKLNKCAVTL